MLNYNDVVVVPQFSNVSSRRDVSTYTTLGNNSFYSHIIPANMKDVVSDDVLIELSKNGFLGIHHRFHQDNESHLFEFANKVVENKLSTISISIGIESYWLAIVKNLLNDFKCSLIITIDVAHAANQDVVEFVKLLYKITDRHNCSIILGNFGSAASLKKTLLQIGTMIDCVKVGIACGKSCETYLRTGVGTPMFSLISEIYYDVLLPHNFNNPHFNPIKLIADGGVRSPGDAFKAVLAGADFVMVGSDLARCVNSAAPIVEGSNRKLFRGSSTFKERFVEGSILEVEMHQPTMTINERIENYYNDGLRSGLSYLGFNSIHELRKSITTKEELFNYYREGKL